jgi:hypothetical protein
MKGKMAAHLYWKKLHKQDTRLGINSQAEVTIKRVAKTLFPCPQAKNALKYHLELYNRTEQQENWNCIVNNF